MLKPKPRIAPTPLRNPEFLDKRVKHYYNHRVNQTWQGKHLLKGMAPGESAILLSTNDYLSIAKHPRIINSQVDALLHDGNGLVMSAVFFHDENPQGAFEAELAEFMQAEDVLIAQSGWCANTGLIQSIANPTTPVYVDMNAHMSLWEGIISAGATAIPFAHNSTTSLARMMKRHGQGIVVVDSVYSTNGDICPLADFAEVAASTNSIFVVDESHSLGTHGPQGAGLVVGEGITDYVHFRTASLAKAFAGRGGIIAGSAENIEYLRYESRPTIFSSAVLPQDIAGFRSTLSVIKKESWRRKKCHDNANYLRGGLAALGYNVQASKSQIMALEAGPEPNTMRLRDALEKRDVFGAVFCAPATPQDCSLIRFSIPANLKRTELDYVLSVCEEIREEIGMKDWPSTKRLG